MVKRLAHKDDKRILNETEIREKGLSKQDFTSSWQGRLYVLDTEHSQIAEKLEIKEKGEYAIKVR